MLETPSKKFIPISVIRDKDDFNYLQKVTKNALFKLKQLIKH